MMLLAALAMTGVCFAAEEETPAMEDGVLSDQFDALDLDELERAAGEYGESFDVEQGVSWDNGLQSLLDKGIEQLVSVVKKAMRSAVLILVIVLLGSLSEHLCGDFGGGG